jgi:4-diphosphocytidyl-2-C-methyl-D-erythritol kinase
MRNEHRGPEEEGRGSAAIADGSRVMTTHFHYDSLLPPSDRQITRRDDGGLDVLAPAKLNLELLVGPVRDDGYHPLDSVVAKIAFYDELTLLPASTSTTLTCHGLPCGSNEDNLALRAARLMQTLPEAAGKDVAISLTKHIPPGMGLGGGSSDAAAVLVGLNALWELGLAEDALVTLGAQLGSDVPLFLGNACSRMTGRGEVLEPVSISPFAALLVMPPVHCSTGEVYGAFDESPSVLGDPRSVSDWARPVDVWGDTLVNDLAGPACRVQPELAEYRSRMEDVIGKRVHVTGSGAGLFVLCEMVDEADAIRAGLPGELADIAITTVVNPW